MQSPLAACLLSQPSSSSALILKASVARRRRQYARSASAARRLPSCVFRKTTMMSAYSFDRGIPVSTQAGKGFFRRQEVHDLIALTRVLADGRDTLALGALLRGPLVGLTEGNLLDIVEGLPPDPHQPDRLQFLDLRTDAAHIKHEAARSVLESCGRCVAGFGAQRPTCCWLTGSPP